MLILLASAYYLMMNIIGFATMAIDKNKAVKHQWRIPEATLLLVAFLGGGIGSWLGMHTFHHKTHKWKFKFCVPFSIVLHIGIILYLITYFK
ncbi:hypothetical protein BMT55_00375 [Listeria newyorkensis]|uniref:DUF1294 domain-containing protein n=1 Tax=Listeria newyorkensis TaxID=1497681 RepID=A0ABX4XRX3_9LIST|nr:DUF1294 domain-containing protein [Listeria newyorkensis]KGL44032.1 membrane protein [Listeria newyorkensis]PNP94838.1 hypothetical protein BMT55_00375 [Listeria newyorkensis]WAO21789.1 DUF1294 domain-containing protein [Listeria newyorkensis]SQC57371.1 Protein of uncharacterised function (DUF1294) [Listeria newyorkensis]